MILGWQRGHLADRPQHFGHSHEVHTVLQVPRWEAARYRALLIWTVPG